jgi:AcrR family transcriptional regulator
VARAAFAEHGADASLEQVARDAGLAIGTLYRHFPCRLDLLLAVYEPRARELLTEAEAALRMDDPGVGFRRCLEALLAMQAGDRGFNDLLCTRFPGDARTEALINRLCDLMKKVIQRGQASGDVRPDITDADIVSLMWANGRIVEATSRVAPNAWRRHLYLMMDAFRADGRHELPEPPLTDQQLYQAMAEHGAD